MGLTALLYAINHAGAGHVATMSVLSDHARRGAPSVPADYVAWYAARFQVPAYTIEDVARHLRSGGNCIPSVDSPSEQYERKRDAMRDVSVSMSRSGRDIGPIPPVVDPVRKDACRTDFALFCRTYFPKWFYRDFSHDHIRVIQKIEDVTLSGGQSAIAMPRGSGKTTLCRVAAVFALVYGHRRFVFVVGAADPQAIKTLDAIKISLEFNDDLAADFPEVCFPIRKLEGISQRANGQLCNGQLTGIVWKNEEVSLPSIDGSPASGSKIVVGGLTGSRVRGANQITQSGESLRPDLVLIDDPQTNESACSPSQSANRERIVNGDILGMAGPDKKIAALMPCTVIQKHDMADNLLDRKKNPIWQGIRTKLVYAFPAADKLWEEYAEIRRTSLANDNKGIEATEFYRANRTVMDLGAKVAWEHLYYDDEISAIQHAMNLRIDRGDHTFAAEYQNEPIDEAAGEDNLAPADVANKLNRRKKLEIPQAAHILTAFVDIQDSILYYAVCAWSPDYTGWIVDYGTFPEQYSTYFSVKNVKRKLADVYPNHGREARWLAALTELVDGKLMQTAYIRDDTAPMRINRLVIDANYGHSTQTVYEFCRTTAFKNIVLPAHHTAIGASQIPFSEHRKKPGDRIGLNWRIPAIDPKTRVPMHFFTDVNWWKNFVRERIKTPLGDPGSLSLFGTEPGIHRMIAEHCTSEYSVRTMGRGRVVHEWKQKPTHPDNHWWDCIVGCAYAASEQGCKLSGVGPPEAQKKKRRRIRVDQIGKR